MWFPIHIFKYEAAQENSMIKYTVVKSDSVHNLVKDVNEHILQGWIPLGGIALSTEPSMSMHYVQAMTISLDRPPR